MREMDWKIMEAGPDGDVESTLAEIRALEEEFNACCAGLSDAEKRSLLSGMDDYEYERRLV